MGKVVTTVDKAKFIGVEIFKEAVGTAGGFGGVWLGEKLGLSQDQSMLLGMTTSIVSSKGADWVDNNLDNLVLAGKYTFNNSGKNVTLSMNGSGTLSEFCDNFKKIKNGEIDIPSAFKQNKFATSYESRISQTPAESNAKVGFEGVRGESLCTLKPPPDPELNKILNDVGIKGIEYKNGVPDFSPVSKAELEIEYMLGGKENMGTKARDINFAQADKMLADRLNNLPELAKEFGMEAGGITEKDIRNFRKKNKYTWHELNDCKTIQLVPSKINNTFGHVGGVGEVNAGAFEPGGFANK